MSDEARLFREWYDEYENDPEYIAHGLLYRITDEICGAMERRNMTRKDLAAKLGVSPQYVTKFLNTPSYTSILQVVRFARAVGLEVEVRVGQRPADGSSSEAETAEAVLGACPSNAGTIIGLT